jgi:hypothetical protein
MKRLLPLWIGYLAWVHLFRGAARAAMGAAVERPGLESPMRTPRTLAAALLLSALLAGPVGATPPQAKPGPASRLSQAWSLVLQIWRKAGCGIDPHGRCVTAPAPLNSTDVGCGIDPSGRCLAAPAPSNSADVGCGIDPDGRCRS